MDKNKKKKKISCRLIRFIELSVGSFKPLSLLLLLKRAKCQSFSFGKTLNDIYYAFHLFSFFLSWKKKKEKKNCCYSFVSSFVQKAKEAANFRVFINRLNLVK